MTNVARIFSWLFHPIFLPIVFSLLILNGDFYMNRMLNPEAFRIILIVMILFTLCIPLLIFVAAKYMGIIESVEMSSKQERIFAITVLGISSWFSWKILVGFELPVYYTDFMLIEIAASMLGLIMAFIKRFSLHMYGWSVFIFTSLWYIYAYNTFSMLWISLFLIIAGIVAWARLEEEKHTPAEIYLGFALGLVPVCVLLVL